jgi:hypothetical protein
MADRVGVRVAKTRATRKVVRIKVARTRVSKRAVIKVKVSTIFLNIYL